MILLPDVQAAAQAVNAAGEVRAVPSAPAGASAGAAAGASAVTVAPLTMTALSLSAPLSALTPSAAPVAASAASPARLAAASLSDPRPAALSAAHPAAAVPAALPAALPASAAASAAALPALKGSGNAAHTGPAARKSDSEAASSPESESAPASALFDGGKSGKGSVKIFLVQHGAAPMAADLSSLESVLKNDPEAARALNKNGGVRLVLGNADGAALASSPEFKAKYPSALGVVEVSPVKQAWNGVTGNPLVKLATFPFRWAYRKLKGGPAEEAPAGPQKAPLGERLRTTPGRVLRETAFLGRTFRDSMTRPLPSEVIGGIATKSFPLATSIGVYWTTVGMSHPYAMAGLMALSLFQEVFHGIFLNTWNNFQESLSRLRGFSYQMYFNLAYMQGFGALYRALSWSANPHKTIPPWSPFYWQDVLVMSLVGTFFGTLGYNGLNQLYAKGRLKRWQRSGIQQLRDVLFLLAGPFFATGSMHAFWALFIFQQALDLAIAVIAWRARTRTVLYVAAEGDMSGDDAARLTETLRAAGVTAPAVAEKLTIETGKKAAAK